MLFDRLFRPRPARTGGRALYAEAVAQARQPALYTDLEVPDTPEGRFEIYTLHVVLLLERLRRQGAEAAEVAQALFDAYVKELDHALRELGVGDLSVGKKMRRLGEAFYGRVKSYETAFAALPDQSELQALLTRTVYAQGDAARAPALCTYVIAQSEALSANRVEDLCAGQVTWGAA